MATTIRVRSTTWTNAEQLPPWSRYTVRVCGRLDGVWLDCVQVFGTRAAAGQWARECSRHLPVPVVGAPPSAWVLVSSLPLGHYARRCGLKPYDGYCYASYDPGAVCVKRIPVPGGYHSAEVLS